MSSPNGSRQTLHSSRCSLGFLILLLAVKQDNKLLYQGLIIHEVAQIAEGQPSMILDYDWIENHFPQRYQGDEH